MLVGDAGVGKTRLLRETLAQAKMTGRDHELVVATRAPRRGPTSREWMARADARKAGANRLYDARAELDRAWVEAAPGR